MSIHDIINYKGREEYFTTPDPIFNNGKKTYKSTCEIPFIYFSLYLKGKEAMNKTVMSGQYKCHECSQPGRPAYHYNHDYFDEFKNKYRKHLPILQRITNNDY